MKRYEQTWKSLCNHPVPEWFRDAKFGIYTHWGPYTVPGYGGNSESLCGKGRHGYNGAWYPRRMYEPSYACGIHHAKTYGDPAQFGYKDLIPLFTGEKFDPAEWVELFKDASARFVGPTAQLHDGFAMWDSKVNRLEQQGDGAKTGRGRGAWPVRGRPERAWTCRGGGCSTRPARRGSARMTSGSRWPTT